MSEQLTDDYYRSKILVAKLEKLKWTNTLLAGLTCFLAASIIIACVDMLSDAVVQSRRATANNICAVTRKLPPT